MKYVLLVVVFVENTFVVIFLTDLLLEELYSTKERNIELSIANDLLNDKVSDLEKRVWNVRKTMKKLQKKHDSLVEVHNNCPKRNVILYR